MRHFQVGNLGDAHVQACVGENMSFWSPKGYEYDAVVTYIPLFLRFVTYIQLSTTCYRINMTHKGAHERVVGVKCL